VVVALENTRREWEEGYRRFEAEVRDPALSARLHAQLEVVTDELRRQVGQHFTLAELARRYAEAERWTRAAVAERAPAPNWPRYLAIVEDAAFHLYSRGAVDYAP
jgi:hypothetical protein